MFRSNLRSVQRAQAISELGSERGVEWSILRGSWAEKCRGREVVGGKRRWVAELPDGGSAAQKIGSHQPKQY
ncbi:hypothetical protein R5W24_004512 [Gemmata sp. JC717]|uniref:hypothetical protein n=1 Tax=Gemmata algarum TaxID=2975278 RepID=UPI0021BBAC04|nr:hypothetical protein [Gemmata algarum]MDY3555369.1 hypothetical protein [Gemmata algarum]